MANTEPPDRVKRIERWWPVALLLLVAAIIAAVGTIGAAVKAVKSVVTDVVGPNWPKTEYEKVDALRLGVDVAEVTQVLGRPKAVSRRLYPGEYYDIAAVRVYTRPGWMAIVASDRDGQVTQWNVISCSERFRPSLSDRGVVATRRRATLQVSPPRDVSPKFPRRSERDVSGYWEGDEASYNVSGTTVASMWGITNFCSRADAPVVRSRDERFGALWSCPDEHESELPTCPGGSDDPSAQEWFLPLLHDQRPRWQEPVNAWGACRGTCFYGIGALVGIDREDLLEFTRPPD